MIFDINEFEKVYQKLGPYLAKTPLIKNEWLSAKYSANIFLKLENLQPVGSFKLRGALNKILNLSDEQKAKGVMAVSAGNHAQGVAWAAKKFGVKATIIMPKPSPIVKILNTEALGAEVILAGNTVDESFDFAREYLEKNDCTYIHPFNDKDIILGQGSMGMELRDQIDEVDFIFGSIGGGGKMSGVGFVAKEIFEDVTIVGSQATGANSMVLSLQKGQVIETSSTSTFADGIKVQKVTQEMFEFLDQIIDEAVHVDDDKIASAVLELMEQARVIAEGAGAINLAAFNELFEKSPRRFKNKNIVIIICGGNIDINVIDRIIDRGLIESKRRIRMTILLTDKPGALTELTAKVSKTGANIIQAVHDRNISSLGLNQSNVDLILETRGPKHTDKIILELKKSYILELD